MRRIISVVLAILAMACDSPTRESRPDFRWGVYSTTNRYSSIDGNALVLWERGDGARFQLTLGTLRCNAEEEYRDEVVFNWELMELGGIIQAGNSGQWEMGEVLCDLLGESGLRFTIASTGETLTSKDELRFGECLRITMSLPAREAWLLGSPWYQSNPLPDGVVFPEPMPEMTFEGPLWCD